MSISKKKTYAIRIFIFFENLSDEISEVSEIFVTYFRFGNMWK